MNDHTLAGRTLRWTFESGPTAGKTYEHVFGDETVAFREADGKFNDVKPKYSSFEVAPSTHLVSYLSPESGFTLTIAVNFETGRIYGFASNDKQWFPVYGTNETVR